MMPPVHPLSIEVEGQEHQAFAFIFAGALRFLSLSGNAPRHASRKDSFILPLPSWFCQTEFIFSDTPYKEPKACTFLDDCNKPLV
jgi:hypothetical protein